MNQLLVMDIVAKNGVTFRVAYGHREYLNGEFSKYPVVSFYDRRYTHTENGQFIADYLPESIFDHDERYGLDLNGGVESWYIDRWVMQNIRAWLLNVTR